MDTLAKFTLPGILLALTLAFGVWVSLVGKPYNGLLFNIHKLIALATVVTMLLQLNKTFKAVEPQLASIILLVVAVICVVALFASGALMSAGKLDYQVMLFIHRIAIGLLVVTLALFTYYLLKK